MKATGRVAFETPTGAAKERLEAGKGAKAGLTVFRAKKISVTKI